MKEHRWHVVVTSSTSVFATCLKCGLSRLVTLSGEFYFMQIGVLPRCSSPYRTEATE